MYLVIIPLRSHKVPHTQTNYQSRNRNVVIGFKVGTSEWVKGVWEFACWIGVEALFRVLLGFLVKSALSFVRFQTLLACLFVHSNLGLHICNYLVLVDVLVWISICFCNSFWNLGLLLISKWYWIWVSVIKSVIRSVSSFWYQSVKWYFWLKQIIVLVW